MDNPWSDLKRILGTKDDIRTDKMHSKQPLIEINSKLPEKKRLLRSHYIFMDLTVNSGIGGSGLLVICETNKSNDVFSKSTLIFLAVIVAFILGLVVGVFLQVNVDAQFSKSNSKETNHLNSLFNCSETAAGSRSPFVDGVFWSESVEESLPSGFSEEDGSLWEDFVRRTPLVKIEEGCGRVQNRLVTFEDGTKACCRYRQNTDQIQGEIFSYYLGRLMKLRNLVPSTVISINSSAITWRKVASQLTASLWKEDHPVVFTRYIDDLLPANIPSAFRHLTGVGLRAFSATAQNSSYFKIEESLKDKSEAIELAQWSDLVVFDYLTANLDRVVNNLYNLQWNPDMLSSPAHNLARTSSELLVFLDNESGLLHGYRLLDKYEPYHSLLLGGVCVFRRSTVDALSSLGLHNNPGTLLTRGLPSQDLLPPLPDVSGNTLRLRVARVLRQVFTCADKHRGF